MRQGSSPKPGAHALTDVTGFGLLGLGATWPRPAESRRSYGLISCRSWRLHETTSLRDKHRATRTPTGVSVRAGGHVRPGHHGIRAPPALRCPTSGGLLAALPGDRAPDVVRDAHSLGMTWAALVGSIESGESGRIHVRTAPQSDRRFGSNAGQVVK